MNNSSKDVYVGVAFAFGYSTVSVLLCSFLFASGHPIFVIIGPLISGLLGIPIYYICKQDRKWHYCVAVAVTTLFISCPLLLTLFTDELIGGDAVLLAIFAFLCLNLPSLTDGLIYLGKAFWRWLGDRAAP